MYHRALGKREPFLFHLRSIAGVGLLVVAGGSGFQLGAFQSSLEYGLAVSKAAGSLGAVKIPIRPRAVQPVVVEQSRAAAEGSELEVPATWRFAHPKADLLAAIRISGLRKSEMVKDLIAQVASTLQLKSGQAERALGSTEDVDEAWISLYSGDSLILVQGRLRNPADLLKPSNGMTYRRISKSAVLIGRDSSLTAALRRLTAGSKAGGSGAVRAGELGADTDIWLRATPALLAQQAALQPARADVTGFSLGISVRDGLKVDVKVDTASAASAERILRAVQRQCAGRPELLLRNTVRLDGTSVRLTAALDRTEFLGMVQQALAGPVGKRLTELAAARTAPGAENPPTRGRVVVYGMEGGPKEFGQQPQMPPEKPPEEAPR